MFTDLDLALFFAIIIIVLFAGYMAYFWRKPVDMDAKGEWSLGGRRFGTVVNGLYTKKCAPYIIIPPVAAFFIIFIPTASFLLLVSTCMDIYSISPDVNGLFY